MHSPPAVARIDKSTGHVADAADYFELPQLSSNAEAWAFAFWGGYFYIFYKTFTDASTNVYQLDPDSGNLDTYAASTGMRIVGAGVSTCAPVVVE